jgi:hypothetical protein
MKPCSSASSAKILLRTRTVISTVRLVRVWIQRLRLRLLQRHKLRLPQRHGIRKPLYFLRQKLELMLRRRYEELKNSDTIALILHLLNGRQRKIFFRGLWTRLTQYKASTTGLIQAMMATAISFQSRYTYPTVCPRHCLEDGINLLLRS